MRVHFKTQKLYNKGLSEMMLKQSGAGGTHPTGMHFCSYLRILLFSSSLCYSSDSWWVGCTEDPGRTGPRKGKCSYKLFLFYKIPEILLQLFLNSKKKEIEEMQKKCELLTIYGILYPYLM